jgi:hypothetical protein
MVGTLSMSGHLLISGSHRRCRVLERPRGEPTLPTARPRREIDRPAAADVRRVAAVPAGGVAPVERRPATASGSPYQAHPANYRTCVRTARLRLPGDHRGRRRDHSGGGRTENSSPRPRNRSASTRVQTRRPLPQSPAGVAAHGGAPSRWLTARVPGGSGVWQSSATIGNPWVAMPVARWQWQSAIRVLFLHCRSPGCGLAWLPLRVVQCRHSSCRCELPTIATVGNVGPPLGRLGPIAVDASGAAPAGIVGVMDDAIDHRCEVAAALHDQPTARQLVGP